MSSLASLSPEEQEAILNGPALTPPPGVTPNFDNPPNNSDGGLAVILVCLILACASSLLYTYGRIFQTKQAHFSDLVGLAALGVFLAFIYANVRVYRYTGFFVHQWDIRLKDIPEFVYSYTLGIVFYLLTLMLIKAAILLQWIRIFVPVGTRNAFFWICTALITVNVLFFTTALLIVIIPCAPFEAHVEDLGSCSPGSKYLDLTSASLNLLLDYSIFSIPQMIIWRLQMSWKRKVGISFAFLIGLLACAAATARTAVSIYYFRTPDFYNDKTYSLSYIALLPLAETACGILVFTVPGTPKAVAGLGSSKLVMSIKSWTSTSVQALRTIPSYRTLRRPSLQEVARPRASENDDNCLPEKFNSFESDPHKMNVPSPESPSQSLNSSEAAIVRTTHFTTTESYDPNRDTYEYPHKHPWV
ncbi:hypothetical protein F5Y11DRAFT_365088 [Daldinia sp. FL1419]|nr:hypothetical protein F5Y11DRAFT_365088 [Daldinia sp. FL1419]